MRINRRPHRAAAGLDVGEEGNPFFSIRFSRSSTAFGNRNPSVVTRSTFGTFGQRVSSALSTRAVVDLPTATEPATPMM
jgi:hypothetical protein